MRYSDFEIPEVTPEIMEKILLKQVEHIADSPSDDEDEDFEMPELTPEIMARMFANMLKNKVLEEMSA